MWLADNIVAVAAIILGACVLVGVCVLGLAGLRLYLAYRKTRARVTEPLERITSSLEETERRQAALPERGQELEVARAELEVQATAVATLARHAGEAIAVLRSPLRYVGR